MEYETDRSVCEPAHGQRELSTDDVSKELMSCRVQVILDVVS